VILDFKIEGFKSIQDSRTIQFKPLTILTGPNSSGKSNLLEAIAVFAQATRLPSDIRPTFQMTLQRGEFFRYPSPAMEFIKYRKETRRPLSFDINFKLEDSEKRLLNTRSSSIGYSYLHAPTRGRREATRIFQSILLGKRELIAVEHRSTRGTVLTRIIEPASIRKLRAPPHGNEILLTELLAELGRQLPRPDAKHPDEVRRSLELATAGSEVLFDKFRKVYPISAARGLIQRVRVGEGRHRGEGERVPSWVGINGQHVIEVLSLIFAKRKHSVEADKIVKWTEKFGIGKIKAGWWGEFLGSDFEDPILRVPLETALASYGARQLLTMITQMFWSKRGDVIMVEEPEISLHPENQVLLHELFSEAISQGKQIICSTHSPFFVLALSKIVKRRLLALDKIAVYHVEKREDGTHAKALKLNKHGFIVSGIPSFMKVEEDLFQDWSESLEESSSGIPEEG